MKVARTGIILNTEKFEDCVEFYRELFDLKELYRERDGDFKLCCLEFGESYLMIETGGKAVPAGKSISENATKMRFNVDDIEQAQRRLRSFGVDAEIVRNDWGSTINLNDPDGNRIGIRDEQSFSRQLSEYSV